MGMVSKLKRTMSTPSAIVPNAQKQVGKKTTKKPRPYSTVLANRRSAARSRARRIAYVGELENSVRALNDRIVELEDQLKRERIEHHKCIVENSALRFQVRASQQS